MAVLPITITGSPLPEDTPMTPQELFDAMVARVALETGESYVLIGTGDVLPSSDEGPFLLNGTTLYVWSDVDGEYVPQTIVFQAEIDPKPFRANAAASHDIVLPGAGSDSYDLELTEEFDPGSVFESNVFVAPVDGFYAIKCKTAISATVGTPTNNIVLFYLKKNGFQLPREIVFCELEDIAVGRTYFIDTILELQAGDTVRGTIQVQSDDASTWTVTQNDTWMSGYKIRNLDF